MASTGPGQVSSKVYSIDDPENPTFLVRKSTGNRKSLYPIFVGELIGKGEENEQDHNN